MESLVALRSYSAGFSAFYSTNSPLVRHRQRIQWLFWTCVNNPISYTVHKHYHSDTSHWPFLDKSARHNRRDVKNPESLPIEPTKPVVRLISQSVVNSRYIIHTLHYTRDSHLFPAKVTVYTFYFESWLQVFLPLQRLGTVLPMLIIKNLG